MRFSLIKTNLISLLAFYQSPAPKTAVIEERMDRTALFSMLSLLAPQAEKEKNT
jgi:hypothetical protein